MWIKNMVCHMGSPPFCPNFQQVPDIPTKPDENPHTYPSHTNPPVTYHTNPHVTYHTNPTVYPPQTNLTISLPQNTIPNYTYMNTTTSENLTYSIPVTTYPLNPQQTSFHSHGPVGMFARPNPYPYPIRQAGNENRTAKPLKAVVMG
ncbi:hypothetical protein VNO77_09195 [Canavalia gladiata]|uniref:Uncharacterized protein n=1 Tax=Canavalia gladiata TaxID=3824 RepID=A0AAN9MAL2_CANGL